MAKPPATGRLADLFLDMVAAERGGAANTLAAYRRDLADLSAYLTGRRRTVATAATPDLVSGGRPFPARSRDGNRAPR